MTDEAYNELYKKTSIDLNVSDNNTYIATVSFPPNAPIDQLSNESHSPSQAIDGLGDGIHYLLKYGNVSTDVKERGRKAAEIIQHSPGVIDASFSKYSNEVLVKHSTLQTDMYSDVVWFGGLEETHWYIQYDREDEFVLSIEYKVNQFAPRLFTEDWDKLRDKIQKQDDDILYEQTIADLMILSQEYNGEMEVVHNPEISEYHRLAGTMNTAEHAHYLVNVRDADVEELSERVLTDLTTEEIEFLAQWAQENIPTEADQYAIESHNRIYQNIDSIEDIPKWVPKSERNDEPMELSDLFNTTNEE